MDNEIEVMRILRLPPMGKLVVEVNGHRFERLADIPNAGARQRLMTAIGELIVFTDGYNTLVEAGVAPPLQIQRSGQAGDETNSPELEAQRAAFLASMERERDALLVQAKQTPDPSQVISAATRNAPPTAEQPSNIVDQIDAILQKHLRSEPKFEGRSIHIEQAPAGGLRINVDGKIYQRPPEITEKDVQLVIKMALKEWEAN